MQNPESSEVALIVDLAGLIEIFGDALYNEFGAVVRELVQNAHDSIAEKCAHDPTAHLERQRIDVFYSDATGILALVDTGVGMDTTQLAQNLNYFARSGKRILQEQVRSASTNDLLYIIGEYGIGFLAAMASSKVVEVWSQKSGTPPAYWIYKRGESTAAVTEAPLNMAQALRTQFPAPGSLTGTIVVCTLSSNIREAYHVDSDSIRSSLLRYTRLLPISLFFNGEQITLRDLVAWSDPAHATHQDWAIAIEEFYGEQPLLVIPLYSPPESLDLQGALWIPPRGRLIGDTHIDVYVKRMFVTKDSELLLPSWARFISGILNSSKLRRIVSGNVIKTERFVEDVRAFITSAIISAFRDLRALPEQEYWAIVGQHDDTIKECAIDNEEFMECVWDKLRFRVRNRRLTIPEYLSTIERRTGDTGVIYYYDRVPQEFSANLVSDATGIPVLPLTDRNNDLFVRQVCEQQALDLVTFRALADRHFKEPENSEEFRGLVAACAESNVIAEIRSYEPTHIPAVLIEDKSMQERRDELLKGLREHGGRQFVEDLEKLFEREKAANRGVGFYLNSANELIQALRGAPYETQTAICLALYNISFMSAMPELTKIEVQSIYTSISSVLMSLLRQTTSIVRYGGASHSTSKGGSWHGGTRTSTGIVRMFMMVPFSDEYRNVETAVRRVFETHPYFFEVVLARDFMYESQLLESIRTHIRQADAFIADVTDCNPNVMFELGAVMITGETRPVFSLRGEYAQEEPPADLKAELFIPYKQKEDSPTEIANCIRSAIERNGRPSHREIISLLNVREKRALTKTLLQSLRYRLDEDEVQSIVAYESIEDFMKSSEPQIMDKTKLRKRDIEVLKGELGELEKLA